MHKVLTSEIAESVAYEIIFENCSSAKREEAPKNERTRNAKNVKIRLKPEEAKRVFEYQKAMLTFAWLQYKRAIGTPKEYAMHVMYNDSLEDYNTFLSEYEQVIKT